MRLHLCSRVQEEVFLSVGALHDDTHDDRFGVQKQDVAAAQSGAGVQLAGPVQYDANGQLVAAAAGRVPPAAAGPADCCSNCCTCCCMKTWRWYSKCCLVVGIIVAILIIGGIVGFALRKKKNNDDSTPVFTALAYHDGSPVPLFPYAGPVAGLPYSAWQEVYVPVSTGAQCGRGDPFSFFIRRGLSNNMLIQFEGGNPCYDLDTCELAAAGYTMWNSTTYYARANIQYGNYSGLFTQSETLNPVKDWTHVYIPLCTGDDHVGNGTAAYDAGYSIRHVGAVNALRAVEFAQSVVAAPGRLLVSGWGSGGVAAIFWSQTLITRFSGSNITVLADAAVEPATPMPNHDTPASGANVGYAALRANQVWSTLVSQRWGLKNSLPAAAYVTADGSFSSNAILIAAAAANPTVRFAVSSANKDARVVGWQAYKYASVAVNPATAAQFSNLGQQISASSTAASIFGRSVIRNDVGQLILVAPLNPFTTEPAAADSVSYLLSGHALCDSMRLSSAAWQAQNALTANLFQFVYNSHAHGITTQRLFYDPSLSFYSWLNQLVTFGNSSSSITSVGIDTALNATTCASDLSP